MKPAVDKEKCINCSLCYGMYPDVFVFDPETGKAAVLPRESYAEYKEQIEEAIRVCPTQAITVEKQ